MKVQYEEIGDPQEPGVYAVRVDHPRIVNVVVDAFLVWIEGRWYILGDSNPFTKEVHGWVGPLPRIRPLRNELEAPE